MDDHTRQPTDTQTTDTPGFKLFGMVQIPSQQSCSQSPTDFGEWYIGDQKFIKML